MALFRKLFYRKPPQGLLEISERVYVSDCCFSMDVLGESYRDYVVDVVTKLQDHWPDGSFMVFNFLYRGNYSQIVDIMSDYGIKVIDYPTQYDDSPLLTLEMIYHFLKSTESWLDVGERNIILLNSEHGGWPMLAFAVAGLLIYRRQYTNEQKTLEMIYKQAPPQLLQSATPVNPLHSQLRYLQYVAGRNLHSEGLPRVRCLVVDCIILRAIPITDSDGDCSPILRIHGLDPLMEATDRIPKLLCSTQSNKISEYFKQADCDTIKIDLNCHIKGDVVLEFITLDHGRQLEETKFRIMFNTAFIKSNTLKLSRGDIDTPWSVQDQFPMDFKAEVLFSELVSSSQHLLEVPIGETGSSQFQASVKPPDFPGDVDRLDKKDTVEPNIVRTQETLGRIHSSDIDRNEIMESCSGRAAEEDYEESSSTLENQISSALESDISNTHSKVLGELQTGFSASSILNSREMKTHPEEVHQTLVKPGQSKLLSPRIFQSSPSIPASESLQKSHSTLSRYQNTHSALGITALLHDTEPTNKLGSHVVALSPRSSLSASIPQLCKPTTPSLLSMVPPAESQPPLTVATSIPAPPPPPPLPASTSLSTLIASSTVLSKSSISVSSASDEPSSPQKLDSIAHIQDKGYSKTTPCPLGSSIPHSRTSLSLTTNKSIPPPPPLPPPRPVLSRKTMSAQNSLTGALLSPTLPSSSCSSTMVQTTIMNNTSSALSPIHEIASSGESIPSVIPDKSSELEISPRMRLLPISNSVTNSNDTVKSLSLPCSVLSDTSPSSSQSLSSSTHSSSLPTTVAPPFPDTDSPSGQLSLVPPGKEMESTTLSSAHLEPLSDTAATSFVPSSALQARSPPSHSLMEAPSPTLDSCSALLVSPGVSSLSVSISSPPPEKSFDTVAKTPQPPPPPPVPPHSRKLSTSAGLPPPTPPGPPKDSMSRISPKIPPPPAPLLSSLPKDGLTLQSPKIPATPAPPTGAKGRLPTAKPQTQTKRSSLKPYHWLKLTRALHGSIWAETWNSNETSKTPEFDMSELESLFSATVSISEHGRTKCKSNGAFGSKSDKVHLIDFRRAYNCEIMLTKIKIPLPDIMSSVLSLDDSRWDADQVDNLIKFCPTKEEMELIKNYKGDIENIGKCEQFLLEMMKVPRTESKLRVFSFKIQFHSRVSDLRCALNLVNSASQEVRNSIKLKRVMQTILSLGNVLNHGTARGSAIGFRLDSLLKLSETRAHNNKMTLMHYLCKVLAEKLPELLDFPKDLGSLEGSTKIQLKYLAEEMQSISKGLDKVTQELAASEKDGPVSESFSKTLKEFLHSAEAEVRSLASLYSVVGKNADALAHYFGEDPVRCPFEQVVSTLLNFVRMFMKAHEENRKQVEFEKKR
ncbi:OLC1v1030349C6 [Oldenlandia corymbosa var. corymbosa]|uniref:Formin-like protein n=1 Tax=Oldenlandia corymbosa var. corymbosa TaxID=529605 RepID=A0AAV1CGM5_OLDCO|nr:OLC1v1030349C6 [Oldenlandia corymbosa var. corymbosa]